ncbi:hypothetical protein GGR57DRAFT_425924 [Xylariaceae sp. FL1272]|nr:hypothetical protein GGR57DRAFT_425924 [Xylariaceae sp. FL1272]
MILSFPLLLLWNLISTTSFCLQAARPSTHIMLRSSSLTNLFLGACIALLCSISLSAPLEGIEEFPLVKRTNPVYDIWNSIPGAQKATGTSALFFPINPDEDNAWGITYLYGCTALVISDPEFVIVAHMQQEGANGKQCIKDPVAVQSFLDGQLFDALIQHDPTDNTRVDLIFNTADTTWNSKSVKSIRDFLSGEAFGVDTASIRPFSYTGSSGTGEANPDSSAGLALVQWQKAPDGAITRGTLKVYFNRDIPIRDQTFT